LFLLIAAGRMHRIVILSSRLEPVLMNQFQPQTYISIHTRKNLLQQFSKQSKMLATYLKENNIDLNNREDLEKLLQFLASL
jgi:hypothetical protein